MRYRIAINNCKDEEHVKRLAARVGLNEAEALRLYRELNEAWTDEFDPAPKKEKPKENKRDPN